MERYQYSEVPTKNINDGDTKETGLKYVFRQTIVSSGMWASYFILGMSMGANTVLVPQLRREAIRANSTDILKPETASWLFSVVGYAPIPWVFILPIISHNFGRRFAFRLTALIAVVGSISFYLSNSITQIFISQILLSTVGAGTITIFVVIMLEYSNPAYRGVFLTMKSSSLGWGIWISNAIGTFFHWKNIGIPLMICSIYIFVSALFWPESPYWLAKKGRNEECRRSYYWLNGEVELKKDLQNIINANKEPPSTNTVTVKQKIRNFFKWVVCKKLYKPIIIIFLMYNLYYCIGKTICMMYAIDIVRAICNSESVAYNVMLILDGFTVFSMYVGCAITKLFPRRVLFFTTASFAVTFLLTISLYLYLVKFLVIVENKYVTASLLAVYSIAVSVGPFVMSTSIACELLPVKCRTAAVIVVGLLDRLCTGTYLKISPSIFATFSYPGAFLFFAVSSIIQLLILYKYLPETKDKTSHEIEVLVVGDHSNGKNKIDCLE